MSKYAKTWWGQRFIAALEGFTDSGRLARGRSYSTDNRIKQWLLQKGKVDAKLRGNTNPYYGVYKEPTYKVSVQMTHLSEVQWQKIIQRLSQRASFIARLLLNEIPENIEAVFAEAGVHLLPKDYRDFKVACDCPDYEVPCKHIAGVCYRLAGQLDQNPFLLFEMRGLASEKLLRELANSSLGKVLSDAKSNATVELMPVDSFYTRPVLTELPQEISLKSFWQGQQPLPKSIEPSQPATIPAMLIKKGGDFPGFWQKQNSFIEVMEDFYLRMRKNTLKGL
ncbi:SWIM zinc finger family protein [Methylobacter tundripaludum]|uniref:SWIM zinc finger family protein n=1 Tax=Methylobacter tundripaludum TaxID=173365 RepID=UPI00047F2F6A|nr:SWIM zinc finger family protein [Methylobacter tundripaludum]